MSESSNQAVGVVGVGTTVAGVATLAKTGMPISIVLAAATTVIALSLVLVIKRRQLGK